MQHPTIRDLSGATPTRALDARRTALLVIDFQNEYFTGRLPIPDGMVALQNAKRLIAHADAHGMPVFHVQHQAPADSPVFAESGPGIEFHAAIRPATHHQQVGKTTVSVSATTDAILAMPVQDA